MQGMDHGTMQMGQQSSVGTGFLPGQGEDISSLPEAKISEVIDVQNGQTITLNPTIVRKAINGKEIAMYGYNGEIPGPLLKVKQGSTFTVNVTNNIDLPTTIHWHGVRLQNKFDGVPDATQQAIAPGGSFQYTVTVPDSGIYWYHPHVREDIEQNMGLYGNLFVEPAVANASNVNGERFLMLSDLLLSSDGSPIPYGKDDADHALMGRFGNTLLVNGSTAYTESLPQGSAVRYYLTNVSNTRTLKLQFTNAKMKLVGADSGFYEKQKLVSDLILAPAERSIVDVYFDTPGTVAFQSEANGKVLAFGTVTVTDTKASPSNVANFAILQSSKDAVTSIEAMKPFFGRPVDETIHLTVQRKDSMMAMDHGMKMGGDDGIEWEDPMPDINASAIKANTQWKLIDEATKAENMKISYAFKKGDKVKIRLVNDEKGSDHPMQHPIHFHGQRFLVLSDNGVANTDLVWKDTVLVPTGHTVDILLDASNPGDWMFHCHIAEHLSNGMMGTFKVSQ
jgi:suppressor of ftsI